VLDHETYFANLTTANMPGGSPKWELLYKAKQAYGMQSLDPMSWHNLSEQIRTDQTMFDKFLRNHVRQDNYTCVGDCRRELLCSLRRGHHNETALCPGPARINVAGNIGPTLPKLRSHRNGSNDTLTMGQFKALARKALWSKIFKWIREQR